jgi:ribosomal protein S14
LAKKRGPIDLSQGDLRAKIRELIASGALPGDPPSIERPMDTLSNRKIRSLIGGSLQDPCTICGDEGPQVSYFYVAGQVVRVLAACDAVWKQEQSGPTE